MKMVLIFLFLFMTSLMYLVLIDILSGRTLLEAVMTLQESYSVLTTADTVIIIVLILVPALRGGAIYLKSRKSQG